MMTKRCIYLALFFLTITCFCQELSAQDRLENLSREGTLHMLIKLDSLINDYARYSSFMGVSEGQKDKFLSLFDSDSALVFDDINPNILADSLNLIRETYKPVRQYMDDILNEFLYFSTSLVYSDVASAAERIYQKRGRNYLKISMTKLSEGALKDSSKCKTINTEADLELWIRLHDTINYEMKIDRILKEGPLGVDWNYTPAQYKKRKMEVHYNLRPLYSQLYPHQFKPIDPPNRVIVNDNQQFDYELLEEMGLPSNTLWGSAGINGEFEFRFVWDKEKKNKTKGFSLGLGGGLYNSFFKTDYYYEVTYQTDQDGDNFYSITNVENLKDSWMMLTADIPIKFSSEKWKSYKKGRYINFGARFSYVTSFGKGKGSLTRKGYYPKYGIILEDLEEYNFVSDQNLDEEYKPNIEPFNVALELNLGRKRRSQKGNTIFYTGLCLGAYVMDFLAPTSNTNLISPDLTYQGVLPMMEIARLGYIGIDFGILKADPNENILRKKELKRSNQYNGITPEGYSRIYIEGIQARKHIPRKIMTFREMEKEDRPVLFNDHKKDPLLILNKYIKERLKLSKEEKLRIESQGDYLVYFSFVIDSNGSMKDLSINNQQDTEFGKGVREYVLRTEFFWEPGTHDGKAIDTMVSSNYQY